MSSPTLTRSLSGRCGVRNDSPQKRNSRPSGRLRNGLSRALLPVMLDAGRAQAGEAVLVDRLLPAQELLGRERVALAGLLEAEQAAADGRHYLGLAPDDPSARIRWRKVGDRQRTSVRPDHILDPRPIGFGHDTLLTHSTDHVERQGRPARLRFA